MVSESNIERCASKKVEPRRGWTRDSMPTRTMGTGGEWIGGSHNDRRREQVSVRTPASKGGGIVRSHIDWGEERNIFYKGVETSPSRRVLKTLRESLKREAQRR